MQVDVEPVLDRLHFWDRNEIEGEAGCVQLGLAIVVKPEGSSQEPFPPTSEGRGGGTVDDQVSPAGDVGGFVATLSVRHLARRALLVVHRGTTLM